MIGSVLLTGGEGHGTAAGQAGILAGCALVVLTLSLLPAPASSQISGQQANAASRASSQDAQNLPDAPEPVTHAGHLPSSAWEEAQLEQSGQKSQSPTMSPGFPPISQPGRPQPSGSRQQHPELPSAEQSCLRDMTPATQPQLSCAPSFNPYQRFLDSAGPHPLTPKQKGLLAYRNVTDPFNFLTIATQSAISVASDPQSPYGPGMAGFGRNIGVAYTETMVSGFFGTFLIPVIAHQDPHYHRVPNASYARRALHATTSVVWAQSDAGTGMVNYATIGTTAIGDALGNLYVPGRQRSWSAGAHRFATALASDPIDNFITEFLPDVARHVNVQIVLIQRVVNEVERQNGGS